MSRTLCRAVCVFATLAFLLPAARAGYTGRVGGTGYPPHDFPADADPDRLTEAERAYIDKIKDEFDDVDTDEEALARARQIRQNVCNAIAMVKCVNSDVGDCLEKLKEKGSLCVSFNMKGAHGTAVVDDKTGWTEADKININAKHVGKGLLSNLSGTFYWLVTTLLHEGTHAGQSYEPTAAELDELREDPKDPTSPVNPCKLEKWKQRKSNCNEIEAHTAENDWIAELEAMKARVKAGDTEPQKDWNDGTKKLFNKLIALAGDAQSDALKALCAELKKNKESNDKSIAKYQAKKDALTAYLAADISTPEKKQNAEAALEKALDAAAKPVASSGGSSPSSTAEPRKLLLGDGQNGVVVQVFDPNMVIELETGLMSVRDLMLRNEDSVLLVAGLTFSGAGAVLGYIDFNGDDVFDPSEQLPGGVQSLQLRGLRDIFTDEVGNVLAFDRGFGPFDDPNAVNPDDPFYHEKVVQLIDFNFDGVPDQVGPALYQGPPLTHSADTFVFTQEAGFPQMFGYTDADSLAPAFSSDQEVFSLEDPEFDGFFNPGSLPFEGTIYYAPTWIGDPMHGDTQLTLLGKPDHLCEVRVLDENAIPIEILALALMSVDPVVVPLSRPLNGGETLQLFDVDLGLGSVRLIIPCFGDIDGDNDVDLTDLSIQLANFGTTSGATLESGDLDGDGDVDLTDLSLLLAAFGTVC